MPEHCCVLVGVGGRCRSCLSDFMVFPVMGGGGGSCLSVGGVMRECLCPCSFLLCIQHSFDVPEYCAGGGGGGGGRRA